MSAVRWFARLLFLAALFAGGAAVGARWPDQLPHFLRAPKPPAAPPAQHEPAASGPVLLASVEARLKELDGQLAAAERDEREAEIAQNVLRKQGVPASHVALREQEELRRRAAARKTDLAAEHAEYLRLRAELVAALPTEPPKPATDTDLPTRVRTFVIRQELVREQAPVPHTSPTP